MGCREAVVWLWVSLLMAVGASGDPLNKCCPRDHQLVITENTFNCTRVLDGLDGWLPRELVNNQTWPDLQFAYGNRPSCDTGSMDLLRFDLSRNMAEFSLVPGRGLAVFKESTLHDPGVNREQIFPPQDFCLDSIGTLSVALLCPCRAVTCVRKCCHDGHVFDPSEQGCVMYDDSGAQGDFFDWVPKVDSYTDYYRLVGRLPKCERFTSHSITSSLNGSQLLLSPDGSLKDQDTGEVFQKDDYCGTHSISNKEMLIFCLKTDTDAAMKGIVYGSMFLFGALWLLATVVITIILPEMRRNLQGKMALAHNVMLFVGYLVTGISQLRGHVMSQPSCEVLSVIIQFSILAAFFWLNVMCIDISWTFSGLQPLRCSRLQSERARFVLYSFYAWGGTILISMATVIVEYLPNVTRFKPRFGTMRCFFNDREAELLFFYGPMAVILIINLFLFGFISFKLFSANKQMKANSTNKENLVLYGKLFILMGVTWVTEVISWAVGGPNYFWYFTDFINLLRSVFIFVIFCCKRSVYRQLRNKVLRMLGKSVPDSSPPHSMKSFCSNDSGKRAAVVAKSLANTGPGSPSETQQSKTAENIKKKEALEMTLSTIT